MLDFLLNPLVMMFAIILAMFFLCKYALSTSKKKLKKAKNKAKSDSITEQSTKKGLDESGEKQTSDDKDDVEFKLVFKKKDSKKLKKTKQKPTISRVYEKVEQNKSEKVDDVQPNISEDELLSKMQFVNSSKTVSRLVKNEDFQKQDDDDFDIVHEHVHEGDGPCVVEELSKLKNHGHFDKSRRLSRCIKNNDFEDMFSSHISDDYLNIDSDRHLNLGEDFSTKLYDRASKTLANSDAKIIVDDGDFDDESYHEKKDTMKSWLENRRREEMARFMVDSKSDESPSEESEDVESDEISARTLILSEMIMNRKRASKRWRFILICVKLFYLKEMIYGYLERV